MALQDNEHTTSKRPAMLDIPYLWEKPGGDVPSMTLEAWENTFSIALMAKFNISIKSLKDDREP